MTILCHILKLPAHGRHQVNAEHCRNRKKPDGPGSRVERQRDFFCAAGRERTRPEPSRRSESGPHRPRRCRPSCGRVRQARDWRAGRWRKQRGLKGTTGTPCSRASCSVHGTGQARGSVDVWRQALHCGHAGVAGVKRARDRKLNIASLYMHFTSLHCTLSLHYFTPRCGGRRMHAGRVTSGRGAEQGGLRLYRP